MATNEYQQPYTRMQENQASSYLQDLIGSIASGRQDLQAQKGQVEGINEENIVLRAMQVEGAKMQGELAQQQGAIDASQALEFENRKKAAASVFGVDLLDPQNRIAYLVNERDAAVDEAIVNSKRAAQLARTNLFDSPFDYLIERPFLAQNIKAGKAAEERAKFIDAEIANVNTQAKSTIETQQAIHQTLTAEEVKIQQKITGLKAAEAVRTLELSQNKQETEELAALRQLTEADLRLADVAHAAKRREDEFLMRREEYRRAAGERASQKKVDQIQWQAYNKAAKALGRPPIGSLEEFVATYNAYKGSEMGKVMGEMINHGSTIIGYNANGDAAPLMESYIGRTPGEAITRLRFVQGSMPAQAKRTAEFLQHEQGEAAKAVRAQNPNAKLTEEQLATLTDARIIGTAKEGKKEGIPGTAKEMHSNVEQPLGGDRVENIYRAPDVNTMGQAYPNLTQTKVWNEVIVPVAAAGKPSPSANQILKQAALKIAEGKITPEQAAGGLKAYFAGAIALNNRTALYKEVGLPVQEGYKVLVDRPEQPFKLQPFGTIDVAADWIYRDKSVGLDMNNESQIINYLMRFGRGK